MTSVLISVGCHIETLQKHHDRSSLRIINKKSAPTISEKYFSNIKHKPILYYILMKGKLYTYTVSYHSNLHVMWVSIVAWEYVCPLNPELPTDHCYTQFKRSSFLTSTGVIEEIRVNDTIIGDPLYEVPVIIDEENNTVSLCYEVHGEPGEHFNLISDTCVSVNALYSSVCRVYIYA